MENKQMMVRQHISPEELQAHILDGEPLGATASQHLASCSCCQSALAQERVAIALLTSALYRQHCPSAQTLSYYCLPDALSASEHTRISQHLATCPLCQAEVAETRQFLEAPF